jgi:hypothetical protein
VGRRALQDPFASESIRRGRVARGAWKRRHCRGGGPGVLDRRVDADADRGEIVRDRSRRKEEQTLASRERGERLARRRAVQLDRGDLDRVRAGGDAARPFLPEPGRLGIAVRPEPFAGALLGGCGSRSPRGCRGRDRPRDRRRRPRGRRPRGRRSRATTEDGRTGRRLPGPRWAHRPHLLRRRSPPRASRSRVGPFPELASFSCSSTRRRRAGSRKAREPIRMRDAAGRLRPRRRAGRRG